MLRPPPLPLLVLALTAAFLGLAARAALHRAPPAGAPDPAGAGAERGGETPPPDIFYAQRALPDGSLPTDRYEAARTQLRLEQAGVATTSAGTLSWQSIGPNNVGGRVTALAVTPGGGPVYLGAANGGVWKSLNGGTSWSCVTDGLPFASVGALALDPQDASVVYAGTGEANGSVDSYDGDGLWVSRNAGASWTFLGLAATGRISTVVVDPQNSQHLLVGAMGRQFSTGPDRGVYRSLDGGTTWNQVLFVSDSTGVTDIAINPAHPDTMYCATWERVRRNTYRRAYGAECGIWRSIDRGANWSRLSAGLPAPGENVGRIALAVAPSRPSTVYAQIASGVAGGYTGLGFYRSTDGGLTWARRDAGATFSGAFGGFAWYFGRTAVDPANPDRVYALGVSLLRSIDGGVNWSNADGLGTLHPDQHAIWIDPLDGNHVFIGCDGGFYSATNGSSWLQSASLPITQFYDGEVDPTNAGILFGGAQDNYSLRTNAGPNTWTPILGGDGFHVLCDPVTPNVVFCEYQYCCSNSGFVRSTSGGPGGAGTSGWVASDRFGWDSPICMNPLNHNLLLAGSQAVYRSTNNGVSWARISGDLTGNPVASLLYGTLTTLDISKADTSVYYAGSDDGHVSRSIDRGANWNDVTGTLPHRWVTRVVADPVDPQGVYVTMSGYTSDVQSALVFRSPDRGASWTNLSAGLPNMPANDLVVDPADARRLYLATDLGVWTSRDRGGAWYPLGAGMPVQVVSDLVLHAASRQLFAFTHGRSAWKLDLNALPAAAGSALPAGALSLSAPWPAPARGAVQTRLTLPRNGPVEVAVYDVVGRRVALLAQGVFAAGEHTLAWDARSATGERASAGIYFVRASAGGSAAVRRVVLAD